jgi:hypothetical protein
MITMGMFVLLVMSVISANRMLVQNTETGLQTEALKESASIANDLFQEIQSKSFDQLVDTTTSDQLASTFSSPSGGSPVNSEWGPSNAERTAVGTMPDDAGSGQYRSVTAFNDVDDYGNFTGGNYTNGYTRTVGVDTANGIRIGGFLVTVRVMYVDPNLPSNPDTKDLVVVNYQTFMKRIEIDVEHPQYLSKITYKSVRAY